MIYESYGFNKIDPEKFVPTHLYSWRGRGNKPEGGLWGSPTGAVHSWYNECNKLSKEEKEFMYPEGFCKAFSKRVRYKLKESARVLRIESFTEFCNIFKCYGTILGYEYHYDENYHFVKDYDISGIDWEKVSLDFDAVIVTYAAIKDIRESLNKMLDDMKQLGNVVLNLNTWDVDTILVNNLDSIEILN